MSRAHPRPKTTFVTSAAAPKDFPPPTLPELAVVGRSNVGKSSLINSMARRNKLVRTGSTPGLTRHIQIFRMKLRDAELDFVDLPGYGYAARSKSERASWGPMIEGFLQERVGLRAVLVLVDIRRGVEDDDRQLLDFLDSIGVKSFIVATKVDKLGSNDRRKALEELKRTAGRRVVPYSVTTDVGRDELWKLVLELCHIIPSK